MAKIEYTTATLSAEIGTTPKELRKFLRSELSGIDQVGKGGRYTIGLTAVQLGKMKKSFAKWGEEAQAKRDAAAQAAQEAKQTLTPATEAEALEALDEEYASRDDDPTDAELEEITDEEIDLDTDEA